MKKQKDFKKIFKKQIKLGEGKDLKFLSKINIDLKAKKELQKTALAWLKYIKQHTKDFHHKLDDSYHQGEMNFIELFFFSKPKGNKKEVNDK